MFFIILLFIIIVGGIAIFLSNANEDYTCDKPNLTIYDYHIHKMVGMKHYVNKEDLGVKMCYALAEDNNKYDQYAISIHRSDNGKVVGYIPAGNEELHKTLKYRGGKADGLYRIQRISQVYYAEAYLDYETKFFRFGKYRNPYITRTCKLLDVSISRKSFSQNGRVRCWLTTSGADMDYDYTVYAVDDDNNLIAYTDDNELQLFDYVQMHEDKVPCVCSTNENQIFVPLNYTEKTIEKKINEYIGK